ncbi:MAG: aminotransferase class I/II-fold pyridoxal phosphate-dependent enzyme [Clostridiales bacterium]|nr:aminotransferase class I/II-fold pyridoxal phosphate-dependent enzyme [Clostridiales bacterium]
MNTPICDFVREYAASGAARLHMPGHKGRGMSGSLAESAGIPLGMAARDGQDPAAAEDYREAFSRIASCDITEISGADELFHPEGIIAESERNASALFGCPTFYSTEGSSLCIRAMLYLCLLKSNRPEPHCKDQEDPQTAQNRRVLAARNCHSSFLSAAVLLDLDVTWLFPEGSTALTLFLMAEDVREALSCSKEKPICVYITTPDYLGHILDVRTIAEVCHEFDVPLVVDNAHGAYLRFLEPSHHPMDLGADLCCDSAHKTLPVLTGGAYLHTREEYKDMVKDAMVLFASTSPSWLILQSLDAANEWLDQDGAAAFARAAEDATSLRSDLCRFGFSCYGEEPLKITLVSGFSASGKELAEKLRKQGIEPEFSDPDTVVLMISPSNTKDELQLIRDTMQDIAYDLQASSMESLPPSSEGKLPDASMKGFPEAGSPEKRMTLRQAAMSPYEVIPADEAEGRVAALIPVSCPPAVPIVMPGEVIGAMQIRQMKYYGYTTCKVVL